MNCGPYNSSLNIAPIAAVAAAIYFGQSGLAGREVDQKQNDRFLPCAASRIKQSAGSTSCLVVKFVTRASAARSPDGAPGWPGATRRKVDQAVVPAGLRASDNLRALSA